MEQPAEAVRCIYKLQTELRRRCRRRLHARTAQPRHISLAEAEIDSCKWGEISRNKNAWPNGNSVQVN